MRGWSPPFWRGQKKEKGESAGREKNRGERPIEIIHRGRLERGSKGWCRGKMKQKRRGPRARNARQAVQRSEKFKTNNKKKDETSRPLCPKSKALLNVIR